MQGDLKRRFPGSSMEDALKLTKSAALRDQVPAGGDDSGGGVLGTNASETGLGSPQSAEDFGLNKSQTLFDAKGGNASHPQPTSLSRKTTSKPSRNTSRETKESKSPTTTAPSLSSSGILDPLSQHLLLKTSTEPAIAQRLRSQGRPESPVPDTQASPDLTGAADGAGDKKKGVSFLSRLSMRGGKKKDDAAAEDDNDSERSDNKRLDGNQARGLSSAASAGGYIPHHKEPPRYIRVKAHNKKNREFNRIFLAQEFAGTLPPAKDEQNQAQQLPQQRRKHHVETGGPVWAMEFSQDGKHLAVAGKDRVVRIFAVISTPEERNAHKDEDEMDDDVESERLSAPVFQSKPVREFHGHSGEILDLSWSKNNFILSAAMDKTVRLWHISRNECLCTFRHKDLVPSIAFHPRDDRFFLAGCVDSTLRLWSIPDKSVAYSTQLPSQSIITAVAFSPDGMTSIAGVLNGLCLFYETEGLKYHTQIHVRSSRGKNAKGSKITGIQTLVVDGGDGDVKVLVTSNDSRIRIYTLKDKSLEVKFKGHENTFSQMRGNFSDDGKYIVCGSEDKKVFIWSTGADEAENKDKRPCESFEAHSDMVTAALFAPTATRQLLGASGDPIYDLCNPPPVTLLSREEATTSQTVFSEYSAEEPSRHRGQPHPEESPAYIARSTHNDGNIIVTSDRTGIIKVFRQDCAFQKRRHENWETGSLSRKFGGGGGGGGILGRSGSILTRTSAGSLSHSRPGSISHNIGGTPMSSDRILSWRQDIESGGGGGRNGSLGGTPAPSERSMSPSKGTRTPVNTSTANSGLGARRHPHLASPGLRGSFASSPTSERFPTQPPTPSFSFKSIEESDEPREQQSVSLGALWNLTSRWRGIVRNSPLAGPSSSPKDQARSPLGEGTTPEAKNDQLSRRKSLGGGGPSKATSDREGRRKSVGGPAREPEVPREKKRSVAFDDAVQDDSPTNPGQAESTTEGEESACAKCGGKEFKAKKMGGKQRFLCRACGTMVDGEGGEKVEPPM